LKIQINKWQISNINWVKFRLKQEIVKNNL